MEEMRQKGKVTELRGKKAVVRFMRSDACGHCNACFTLGSNEADVEIDNLLGAKVGDTVAIELHGKSVFKASMIVYGVPLIGLVAGAFLGSLISEVFTAVGAILLAGGSFFILRALEPHFSKKQEFKPRMTEILDDEGGTDDAQTPDDR